MCGGGGPSSISSLDTHSLFPPTVGNTPVTTPSRFISKRKDDDTGSGERPTGFLSRAFSSRKLTKKDSPKTQRQKDSRKTQKQSWFGRARSESVLQDTETHPAPLNRSETTQIPSTTSPHTSRQRDSPLLKHSFQPRKDSILEDDEENPVPSKRSSNVCFTGPVVLYLPLKSY